MKKLKMVLVALVIIAIVATIAVTLVSCSGSKGTVKIGLITLHDSSSTYDKNFIDALEVAKKDLEAEGYKVETIVKSGIPESDDCYQAAADLVDQGCSIIFADSFGHEDYMIKAAKEFTNVTFCHATGTKAHTEKLANYHNAFASIYEGRYLAGVAAGMKLAELYGEGNGANVSAANAKVGYVGAFTYAEVISGYTSWFLGVQSIVPAATMEVKFTGSWYDPTAEKEAANTLIANGAKLVSQHADSMGAPTACDEAGIPNVTYNVSTKADCANTYVIASRINWAPYYKTVVKAVLAGETLAYDYVGTLATGSVEVLEVGTAAAAGTAEKIAEVKAKIISGELKIFDTTKFTVGGSAKTEYLADVDTDAAFTPDTQVIANGVFEESKYRSAPYFDLKIDGITLLNTAF